jgi:hypothetical protein
VPGNANATYRIEVNDAGRVFSIALQLKFQDCYE